MNTLPEKEFFSTGEVAEQLSVTRNAVFKWIQSGIIDSSRTPGGHHRIHRDDLKIFLKIWKKSKGISDKRKSLKYCWDYYSRNDQVLEGCRKCVVFISKTKRCYKLVKYSKHIDHSKVFCNNTCSKCDYYINNNDEKYNILIVNIEPSAITEFKNSPGNFNWNLRFAADEYSCAKTFDSFIPDVVIISSFKEINRNIDFINNLFEDQRIPHAMILLFCESANIPDIIDNDKLKCTSEPLTIDSFHKNIEALLYNRGFHFEEKLTTS